MFRRLGCLFEYLFRRHRLEDDLAEELRTSVEMMVDRFVARGMSPAEARRAAQLEFEGVEQVKERVRDALTGSGLQSFHQDLRYALRGLRRRPSFALIALVMLALGIGVNTAIFSVFYGMLLRPLPYNRPEQLALIWTSFRTAGNARAPVSGAILKEIECRNRSLAGVAGIWTITRTFTGDDPEQVKCARATANFFDVLGVRAGHGRTFANEDSGGPAILLTDAFFRRRFAGGEIIQIHRRVELPRTLQHFGMRGPLLPSSGRYTLQSHSRQCFRRRSRCNTPSMRRPRRNKVPHWREDEARVEIMTHVSLGPVQ